MTPETHWTRSAWLILALAAGLLFAPVVAKGLSLGYPTDGWDTTQLASGAYQLETQLTDLLSPLRAGDVILAINGQPLRPLEAAPLPPDLRVGQTVRYTIERVTQPPAVEQLAVDVTLVHLTLADAVRLSSTDILRQPAVTLVPSLCFLVALIVFLLRPGSAAARYMLLAFAFYGPGSIVSAAGSHFYQQLYPGWLSLLRSIPSTGWTWVFFPSLTLLALTLPVRLWPLTRWPRLLPFLLYGVPLALNAIAYAQPQIGSDNALIAVLVNLGNAMFLLAFLAAVFGGLIYNARTLRTPAARAQLRWIAFGMGVGWGVPLGLAGLGLALNRLDPQVWAATVLWLTILLPISLAVAILRYRLFDIDVIIRRTLIYSALTAVLALAYFGSVVVLQGLLSAATGESRNALATVISTLAIAALFGPARTRVQRAIDRRFYRRKYDAARTLAAFGAQARDVVELEQLQGQLVRVVDETMQPASVGLWVRGPAKPGGGP